MCNSRTHLAKLLLAVDPKTMQIVAGDVQAQTERVLLNLGAVLKEAGSSFDKVVKTTVFLKVCRPHMWLPSAPFIFIFAIFRVFKRFFIQDMNDFAKMNEIYAKHFGDARPARSAVEVARLHRDVLVEIEAIGVVA